MQYEIYVDSLILLNLGMNLYLLELTNCVLHNIADWKRIFLGAICGSISSVLPFLLPGNLTILISVGFMLDIVSMSLITFRTSRVSAYWKVLEVLSVLTIVMGTFLHYVIGKLPDHMHLPLFVLLLFGGVFFVVVRRLMDPSKASCRCRVELRNGKSRIKIQALIDTGNSLVEPISGAPVAVLDRCVFENLFMEEKPGGFRVIPYRSVDKKAGLLLGYRISEMWVEWMGFRKEYHDVYVAVHNKEQWCQENCKMIINPRMLQIRKFG